MCGHVGPVPLAMRPGASGWLIYTYPNTYTHVQTHAQARMHGCTTMLIRLVIWCQTSTGTPIYKRWWSRVFLDIWEDVQ